MGQRSRVWVSAWSACLTVSQQHVIRDEDSDVGIDLAAQTAWVGGVVFGFVCGFECGQQGKEGAGVGCSLRDDVTWCLLANMLMHA